MFISAMPCESISYCVMFVCLFDGV